LLRRRGFFPCRKIGNPFPRLTFSTFPIFSPPLSPVFFPTMKRISPSRDDFFFFPSFFRAVEIGSAHSLFLTQRCFSSSRRKGESILLFNVESEPSSFFHPRVEQESQEKNLPVPPLNPKSGAPSPPFLTLCLTRISLYFPFPPRMTSPLASKE